jgi:transcriptional regulator with XRE-family HTH domain
MEDVAKKLGVTRCAVEHRSNRLGIKWNQGIVTRRGIARALGVSERTVKRYTELLDNRPMGIKEGKMSTKAIPVIAQAILDNPIALGRCAASLKQLEKAAAGEWDAVEVWEVGKEEPSQVPVSQSHMSMWESGV